MSEEVDYDSLFEELFGKEEYDSSLGLMIGDVVDCMMKIESKSIDLIMADGPYFISKEGMKDQHSRNKDKGGGVKKHDFGEWDRDLPDAVMPYFLKQCKRVLKDSGSLILWSGYEASVRLKYMGQKEGLRHRRYIHWVRHGTSPLYTQWGWTEATDQGSWFTATDNVNLHVWNQKPNEEFEVKVDRQYFRNWFLYNQVIVDRLHECEKPQDLYIDIMSRLANPGARVLEPFAGSAPAAEASAYLGMKWIGIEYDKSRIPNIKKRLQRCGRMEWLNNHDKT